jgi:hypothetical protein
MLSLYVISSEETQIKFVRKVRRSHNVRICMYAGRGKNAGIILKSGSCLLTNSKTSDYANGGKGGNVVLWK